MNSPPIKVYPRRFTTACKNGDFEQVKWIFSIFPDILDIECKAICWAALYGHLQIIEYLVSKGADVEIADNCSITWAATNGHLEVVKYLVSKGANARIYNDEPAFWASNNNHLEVIKYLVTECGVPPSKVSNNYPIYIQFCNKMTVKTRDRAQKKIYFWWIQICYDISHPSGCGQRMAQKNLDVFENMMRI